jgi:MarR family transcriptional regulator, 2-MHQ and catechol-resistance regulon repressor
MLHQPHTISAILDRMEKDGLVRRFKDMKRKSMVRLEITSKGRDLLLKSSSLKTIRKIISALSSEERLQLRSLLFKLREAACQTGLAEVPLFPPMNTNSS